MIGAFRVSLLGSRIHEDNEIINETITINILHYSQIVSSSSLKRKKNTKKKKKKKKKKIR